MHSQTIVFFPAPTLNLKFISHIHDLNLQKRNERRLRVTLSELTE